MCLAIVALDAHPRYNIVIAANRDEFHARPAAPAHWWAGDMLAGQDLVGGGAWFGVSRRGRWALVTNFPRAFRATRRRRRAEGGHPRCRTPHRRCSPRPSPSMVRDISRLQFAHRRNRPGSAPGQKQRGEYGAPVEEIEGRCTRPIAPAGARLRCRVASTDCRTTRSTPRGPVPGKSAWRPRSTVRRSIPKPPFRWPTASRLKTPHCR